MTYFAHSSGDASPQALVSLILGASRLEEHVEEAVYFMANGKQKSR